MGYAKSTLATTGLWFLFGCQLAPGPASHNGINGTLDKIPALPTKDAYNPAPVGPPVLSMQNIGGADYNCTSQPYSYSTNPDQLAALNPNADVLWPGSVVQGASISSGILDPVPVKRAPGTITLTLLNGGTEPYSADLPEPRSSTATQAMNQILAGMTQATPAKFSFRVENVYSMSQLMVSLDASAQTINPKVSADLKFDDDQEYQRVMVNLMQEYFTMAFDPPNSAQDFFDPSVTAEDLAPYTGTGNPLAYVSSVTYGRQLALLFESKLSATNFSAAVGASFKPVATVGVSAEVDAGYKSAMESSKVKEYAQGGNSGEAFAVTSGSKFDPAAFNAYVQNGATFGPQEPPVPISYTLRYVKDSKEVRVNLTTDYEVKQCTPVAEHAQNFKVKTTRFFSHDTCSFWSWGPAQYYWTFQVDVLDRDNATQNTIDWSVRPREAAATVYDNTDIPVSFDEVNVLGAPVIEGACLRVHGAVKKIGGSLPSDDHPVGDFTKMICYDGTQWAGLGPNTVELASGGCGAGATLGFTVDPL